MGLISGYLERRNSVPLKKISSATQFYPKFTKLVGNDEKAKLSIKITLLPETRLTLFTLPQVIEDALF